jgi:hypothetical protein
MSSKFIIAVLVIILPALSAGDLPAWDPQWQLKQETHLSQSAGGIKSIEMQKKYDYDTIKRFRGITDIRNGYTIMRNLDGGSMRGYIDKDGCGLLRDQDGNFYRVNTR